MNILLLLYKSRINKSGQVPIMMRISFKTRRTTFATSLFIEPALWDQDKQKIKGNSTLIKEMNNVILNLTTAAWNVYNDHIKKEIPIDPEMIRNIITKRNKEAKTLTEAISYQIDYLQSRVGHDTAINTVKKYQTLDKKVKSFLSMRLNQTDIYLHELNYQFITDLDLFMRTHENLKHNAVMKNMQQLKRIIKVCLNNGWLDKDPFLNYSTKMDETDRGYLTSQELESIEKVVLPNQRLELTRDIFVFCCYTGLSYADVSKLSPSHLERDSNGIDWIKLTRTKTKSKSVIPILPKAQAILNKYRDVSKPNAKLLPVISNQNLNKYLKEIAELTGISKRVSMHLARHTFATTVTLERGVDITTVSRMLGHKKLSTTQIYSKVTELKIALDMQKLMDEKRV
jgi:site-specific recombinase XerD